MSASSIPPPTVPSRIVHSPRALRVRWIITMCLSGLAIAGSLIVLYFDFSDPRFLSLDGTVHMDPFRVVMRNTMLVWSIPAVLSVVPLSGLPRGATLVERLPKISAITAMVLSGVCVLIPTVLTILFIGSFLVAPLTTIF